MNKNLIEKIAPQLTELMIKKMETLTEEWRKPWIADLAHGLPRNLRGTPYRGGNILMLLFLSEIAGYSTPLFMTFKQAKEEGLFVQTFYKICLILMIVGGINWGLVGLFQFDFVGWLLGGSASIWSRIVFTLVGVAAVCGIPGLFTDETGE